MASLKNNQGELHSDKVVIVTGPTFGTVMSFILLGVAVGAAATLYLRQNQGATSSNAEDAVLEGISAGGAKDSGAQLMARANRLAQRLTKLAGRARETLHAASEAIGPAVSEAVSRGKRTASETEQKIREDIEHAPTVAPAPEEM